MKKCDQSEKLFFRNLEIILFGVPDLNTDHDTFDGHKVTLKLFYRGRGYFPISIRARNIVKWIK